MIVCPVCNSSNHHLAVVCTSCGSFLQRKVDNLDLFETSWTVLESPRRGFRSIAIAHHKNYVFALSSLAGIGFAFTYFWLVKAGDVMTDLIGLLAAGISSGIIVGPFIVLLFSLILKVLTIFGRTKVGYRNLYAVSSYSLLPVVISVFTLLPVELLTFGTFMFSRNPSPYLLKPVSYIVILSLDGMCALWTIVLLATGMKVLLDSGWKRAWAVAFISLLIFFGLLAELFSASIPRMGLQA